MKHIDSMATKRISYIDALRGFTIALVVCSHVFLISFGNNRIFASQLMSTVMLPLFFFISGFFAYKAANCWTGGYIGKNAVKKFVALIIPATIFFCLFQLVNSQNILNSFIRQGFQDYWFTFALFAIFMIYYAVSWISHIFKSDKVHDIALIFVSVVAFVILMKIFSIYWYQKFAMSNVCLYFPFFVFGIFTRKYYSQVEKLLKGSTLITVAIIVFVASLFLCYHPTFSQQVPHLVGWILRLVVVRVAGVIIVFAFFYRHAAFFDVGSRVSKAIIFTGKRTLDIYLIHFFLLPDLTALERFFTTNSTFVLQLLSAVILAVVIISCCLAISSIIRMSPFLSRYLLGDIKR